jgi:hypothetical protein
MLPETKLQAAVDSLDDVKESFSAEVCGLWLWVSFGSKPLEDTRALLKGAGFRWARRKKKWYFAAVPSISRGSKSMGYIRNKYGSDIVEESSNE